MSFVHVFSMRCLNKTWHLLYPVSGWSILDVCPIVDWGKNMLLTVNVVLTDSEHELFSVKWLVNIKARQPSWAYFYLLQLYIYIYIYIYQGPQTTWISWTISLSFISLSLSLSLSHTHTHHKHKHTHTYTHTYTHTESFSYQAPLLVFPLNDI